MFTINRVAALGINPLTPRLDSCPSFSRCVAVVKERWLSLLHSLGHRSREGGTIMQIVPRRFCHISTKMSWGSSRRSPIHPSWLKRGHPSAYPTPLGTNPPSALAMRPPRIPARSTPMFTAVISHHETQCRHSIPDTSIV